MWGTKVDEHQDESLFDIDSNRLDQEWLSQPRRYFQEAKALADARAEWERAKATRDVVAAEIDRDIRSDPTAFGLEKITEAVVERTTLLQSRHKSAIESVIDAKHKTDIRQAVVDALDQKKSALENAVKLQLANYYSEPKAPEEAKEKIKKMERDSVYNRRKK